MRLLDDSADLLDARAKLAQARFAVLDLLQVRLHLGRQGHTRGLELFAQLVKCLLGHRAVDNGGPLLQDLVQTASVGNRANAQIALGLNSFHELGIHNRATPNRVNALHLFQLLLVSTKQLIKTCWL